MHYILVPGATTVPHLLSGHGPAFGHHQPSADDAWRRIRAYVDAHLVRGRERSTQK